MAMGLETSHGNPTLLDRWLEDYIPLDPLLKEPFDLSGARVRRVTMAREMLRQLGLEERLDQGRIRTTTYEVLVDMLEPLGDVRNERRVHLPTRAKAVCGEGNNNGYPVLDKARAAGALMDIGWGHLVVEGGQVREVLTQMRSIYIGQMGSRVLTMFRKWEREGWVVDSDHNRH